MTKPHPAKLFKPAEKMQAASPAPVAGDALTQETRARLASMRDLAALQLLYGQPEQAQKLLRVALWIDGTDGRALRLMAHSHARLDQPIQAANTLVAASKAGNGAVRLRDWRDIGLALLKGGRRDLAMRFLNTRGSD